MTLSSAFCAQSEASCVMVEGRRPAGSTRTPCAAVLRKRAAGGERSGQVAVCLRSAAVLQRQAVQRRRARCRVAAQLDPSEAFNESSMRARLKRSGNLEPSFALSAEDAVVAQLKALQHNSFPTSDHGIEVLYKFAGFDPFARTRYFGVSLDLGQFERFRRIFYTPCYTALLNHTRHEFLSKLEITDSLWKARVEVENGYRKETRVYEFTMERRFGGRFDGYWYCSSLTCDACDDRTLYGIM